MNIFKNLLWSTDIHVKRYWAIVSLAIVFISILIFIRYPGLVENPRFWAEETIYFETFLHADEWVEGFDTFVYPAYYNFLSRLFGLLSTFVSIENAPAVTTFFGFLTLITPVLIIFFSNCKYWKSLKDRVILSLFLIVSCTTGEIWLNSTNVHFITPIISFLILIDENVISKFKNIVYTILLFIASISGPITLLMSPFFLVKFIQEKKKIFLIYCVALLIGGMFQLSYYYLSAESGFASPSRFNEEIFTFKRLYYLISTNVIFPMFGYFSSIAFKIGLGLINSSMFEISNFFTVNREYSFLKPLALFLFEMRVLVNLSLIIILSFFFSMLLRLSGKEDRVYFLYLFLYLSLSMSFLSLGGDGGFRYSYITSFILLFFLYTKLPIQENFQHNFIKYILFLSIFIGFAEYKARMVSYSSDNWPIWKEEVFLWRGDKDHNPLIWPSIKPDNPPWPKRDVAWSVNLNHNQWTESNKKYSEELIRYIDNIKGL
ncbi:hypothetical protein HOL24_05350 [bacterium]|nr:hypothetical protein [bacterium]